VISSAPLRSGCWNNFLFLACAPSSI
jgi:hypothetical protein